VQSKKAWVSIIFMLIGLAACTNGSTGGPDKPSQFPTPRPPRPTLDSAHPTATPEILRPTHTLTIEPSLVVPLETTPVQVELTTRDGVELIGTAYPPVQAKAPGLLLLHMFDSNRKAWHDLALTAQVKGYAALAIDLRGHGQSGGERDLTAMDQDVEAALAWLEQHEKIDAGRIAIVGASIGANLALRGGANHPQVKAVSLLSPGLDYRGLTTQDAVVQYGQRPLLIIAAEDDTYAAQSAQNLNDLALGAARLKLYSGSAHGTNLFSAGVDLTDELFTWLGQVL
jgi:dienelactone hydrolase